MLKPKVRNEEHEAYRAGRLEEISSASLEILRAEHPELEGGEKKKSENKSSKDAK